MKNNLTIQTKNSFRKHLMTKIIVINISTETRKTNTTENQKRILTLILENYNASSPNNHHKTLTGEHTNKKALENYQ